MNIDESDASYNTVVSGKAWEAVPDGPGRRCTDCALSSGSTTSQNQAQGTISRLVMSYTSSAP